MKKPFLIGWVCLLIFLMFVFVEIFLFLNTAPMHEKAERIIMIQKGAPFSRIAKQLQHEGIITHELKFYLLARWLKKDKTLKAGEYLLYTNLKPLKVLDMLVSGKTYLYRLTIPEGFNLYQIADSVVSLALVSRADFLKVAKDPMTLQKFNIQGLSVEGYLFPESYFFSKPVTAEKIIETMVSKFQKNYTEEIAFKASKLGLNKLEVVTLAAMIEKETGIPEERRLISAVFHNRLKRGMKLQSDPTVIYGIYETYKGNLTKRHLLTPSLYNTYVREGFPIGPIANPGRAALEAAVNPAPVNYLYFVSKNDGSHVFSTTYREHINAVNRYQKIKNHY